MRQCTLGRNARIAQSLRRKMTQQEGMPFIDLLGLDWVTAIVQKEVKVWRVCVYTPLVSLKTVLAQEPGAEQC